MGHFEYLGKGRYHLGEEEKHATHMSFLAGGTGITPILQVTCSSRLRHTRPDTALLTQMPPCFVIGRELIRAAAPCSIWWVPPHVL